VWLILQVQIYWFPWACYFQLHFNFSLYFFTNFKLKWLTIEAFNTPQQVIIIYHPPHLVQIHFCLNAILLFTFALLKIRRWSAHTYFHFFPIGWFATIFAWALLFLLPSFAFPLTTSLWATLFTFTFKFPIVTSSSFPYSQFTFLASAIRLYFAHWLSFSSCFPLQFTCTFYSWAHTQISFCPNISSIVHTSFFAWTASEFYSWVVFSS